MPSLPLLVEPDLLTRHLNDENLLIIDLSSPEQYAQGHLPGAINLDPRRLLCGLRRRLSRRLPLHRTCCT